MGAWNELTELYDCLSILYGALPADTQPDWKRALKSVLYGDELLAEPVAPYGKQQNAESWEAEGLRATTRERGSGNRVHRDCGAETMAGRSTIRAVWRNATGCT